MINFLLPKKAQNIIFGREIIVNGFIPPRDYHCTPDPVLGDHYYTDKQYYKMFRRNGFIVKSLPSSNVLHKSFILF